jgi:glycosyltransferase involved in cell wall biosynthesis
VSIVEAMASGCIPIVHNSGGPREFVPHRLRFDTLEEAATKIEKAILQWTPQQTTSFI